MYAKVFASLWDGTLAEPYSRWAVFVFMLAHADADGNLDMTLEAIARRSCVPLEEVRTAIGHLEAPDPASRSPEEEGRRLVRIDSHREWGWHIVNYPKYRGLRDLDERRRQTREAVARHKVSHGKPEVSRGKPKEAQAEVEVEVEVEESKSKAAAEAALANIHRLTKTLQPGDARGCMTLYGNLVRRGISHRIATACLEHYIPRMAGIREPYAYYSPNGEGMAWVKRNLSTSTHDADHDRICKELAAERGQT